MQADLQKSQQEYELKIKQMEQQVQELVAKYQTQSDIDSQRNAKDIAMANINNAAKERVAMIQANAQLNQQQAQLMHEQNQSAFEATRASEQDIRQHGIAVQQKFFQAQADQQNHQLELEKQALLADQQHQQALEQQAMAPKPTIPPTGAQ
jgi:RecJ-like exonuclease